MAKADAIRNDQMWNEIDGTGYANGDKFESEKEVRDYFTAGNMREMFSGECATDQQTLDQYADVVIKTRRHCNF